MVKLILKYGNASINCKHGSGRTPLMEAVLRENTPMVELLLSAGADVDAECETSTSNLFYECTLEKPEWLYSRHCNQPVWYNRNRVGDFSWHLNISFLSKSDNSAIDAGIYDKVDFINATYGNKINSIPLFETLLRYVAVCHSLETLKYLLDNGDWSKFTSAYEDGKTLLHFATLGSSKRDTETYVTESCASTACVCPNKTSFNMVGNKRFETVLLLTEVLASEINKRDKHGRTALHYAAVHVLPKIAEILIKAGADWRVKDERGDTALEYALRERPFDNAKKTLFDELASYLLQNATNVKCNTRRKRLLGGLVDHRLPKSLSGLFQSGLEVDCAREQFKRLLNKSVSISLRRRFDDILEVFKNFQIDMEVICEVSFCESELHLMAYLGTSSLQVGNFFKPSVNGNSFPLQRFIANNPKGVNILNQCYDSEGFLAIHRAVQGTNSYVVAWSIEIGVDFSKKTKSGLTALGLATYHYPRSSSHYPQDNLKRLIFKKLLGQMEDKGFVSFCCNAELVDLSPLHIAGSRGMEMLNTLHVEMPDYPLICSNSDGIQPFYLAYLYHATNPYMSRNDKHAFQDLGLSSDTEPIKYPKREAEYHLIYNQFYRTPKVDLRNVLNNEVFFECPGISELLPYKTVIVDSVKLSRCATRCWQFAFEASNVVTLNFPYLPIQTKISNPFTDRFIDVAAHMAELRFYLVKMFHFNYFRYIYISKLEKKLWRIVMKAHSCANNCSCFEVMLLLQETFTSEPTKYKSVGKLVTERMGWDNSSVNVDVLYRWPFKFLLEKALRADTAYNYLEILSPHF